MATECTRYRHTQPLLIHPHCRHCFLHLPLCIAGGFGVRRKGPYGLNQNIFFHFEKIRIAAIQSRRQRSNGKCFFPKGLRALEWPCGGKCWWPRVAPFTSTFLFLFTKCFPSAGYTNLVLPCPALPCPTSTPCLETAPGRVNSVQLCCYVDGSGRAGIRCLGSISWGRD